MARTARQSQRLKRAFLAQFAEHGNITLGARNLGIDRTTVYWWQEHDEDFAQAFRLAEIQATEVLEAEARRRAVDGVERLKFNNGEAVKHPETGEPYREIEYSDTLLIFLLKARNPAKYRDNSHVELTGQNGGPIALDAQPGDRVARRIAQLAARIGTASLSEQSES